MLLEVKDIQVYYGAIHAIKGVSFEVNEGEIVTARTARERRRRSTPSRDFSAAAAATSFFRARALRTRRPT